MGHEDIERIAKAWHGRPEDGKIRRVWFLSPTQGAGRLRGAPEEIIEERIQRLNEECIYEQDETNWVLVFSKIWSRF